MKKYSKHTALRSGGKWSVFLRIAVMILVLSVFSGCEPAKQSGAFAGSQPLPSADSAENEAGEAPPVISETAAACEQLIAHAGGAVYGYSRSNSREALDASYQNGFRYFEVDLERTSDGEIVLIHDWTSMAKRMFFEEGEKTLEEFKTAKTFMDLTVMDLDDLLRWLRRHPTCKVITDIKRNNLSLLKDIRDAAGDDISRFIPQVYSYEEYDKAVALGYEDAILTLYKTGADSRLTEFARSKKPWAITLPESLLSEKLLSDLSSTGVRIFSHTINTLDTWEKWHEKGLYGIYTDYFMPAHWPAS